MTLDIVDDLGHAIDDRSMQFALDHLALYRTEALLDEVAWAAQAGMTMISSSLEVSPF